MPITDYPNVSKYFGGRKLGYSKEELVASSSIDKISEVMRTDHELGVEIAKRSARAIVERLHIEGERKIASKFIQGLLRAYPTIEWGFEQPNKSANPKG